LSMCCAICNFWVGCGPAGAEWTWTQVNG
jgi:hypothetical protein